MEIRQTPLSPRLTAANFLIWVSLSYKDTNVFDYKNHNTYKKTEHVAVPLHAFRNVGALMKHGIIKAKRKKLNKLR